MSRTFITATITGREERSAFGGAMRIERGVSTNGKSATKSVGNARTSRDADTSSRRSRFRRRRPVFSLKNRVYLRVFDKVGKVARHGSTWTEEPGESLFCARNDRPVGRPLEVKRD